MRKVGMAIAMIDGTVFVPVAAATTTVMADRPSSLPRTLMRMPMTPLGGLRTPRST